LNNYRPIPIHFSKSCSILAQWVKITIQHLGNESCRFPPGSLEM
jgi:hypothetical protein